MNYYLLKSALQSLWHERWINLISVISIATTLFILGFSLVGLYNLQRFVKDTPESFTVMVFMKPEAKEKDINTLMASLRSSGLVKKIDYISKEQAFEDVKKALGQEAYILDGLEENPLFATLEIKLKEEALDRAKVESLVVDIKKNRAVERVLYGEGILGVLTSLYKGARLITVLITVLFSIAVAFISASTVKILFFRRQDEIEILKLLGATRTFISVPFIIEGSLLGFMGGLISGGAVFGVFDLLKGLSNPEIPLIAQLEFPLWVVLSVVAGGLLLGFLGSVFALGRIKY